MKVAELTPPPAQPRPAGEPAFQQFFAAYRPAVAKVLPLKIAVPIEGVKYAFTKTMSTEPGARIAVKSTFLRRGAGTALLVIVYLLLWLAAVVSVVLGVRQKARGKLTAGAVMVVLCLIITFSLII